MTQLTDLPTEILDEILHKLGPFDHGKLRELTNVTRYFEDYRASLKSLAFICRTCKALHRLAQPIIYRFPLVHDDGLVSLTRTLTTQEGLRMSLQGLAVHLSPYYRVRREEVISPDDLDLFSNLIAKYPTRANGEPINISPTWSTGDGCSEYEFTGDHKLIMAALILTQIPNVERISIDMGLNADFPFCQRGSLRHLVEFTARYSSRYGIDMAVLDGVLEAAPALKALNAANMTDPSRSLRHGNITDLDLADCAFRAETFRHILQGFPNLERLSCQPSRYAMVSDEIATAYEVLKALPIRADTLRHIYLLLEPVDWEEGLYEDPIPSLKGMTVLETLHVDFANLYPDEAETGLVEFLPPSIQTYEQNYSNQQLVPVMLALAEGAPRKFPNLRKVSFGRLYDDNESSSPVIERAFRERGVECIFEPDVQQCFEVRT
ncbi:hypothetical protein ACHAPT_005790 [Fusarium lateritium]